MSLARQRARSRKTSRVRNPLSVLATDVLANDNTKVGVNQVRHVTVTARKPVGRLFVAPRIDMGEYSPVKTHDIEMDRGLAGWNGAEPFEPGPTVVNPADNHLPVGLADRLLDEIR